jgi:hypothetical protein
LKESIEAATVFNELTDAVLDEREAQHGHRVFEHHHPFARWRRGIP